MMSDLNITSDLFCFERVSERSGREGGREFGDPTLELENADKLQQTHYRGRAVSVRECGQTWSDDSIT